MTTNRRDHHPAGLPVQRSHSASVPRKGREEELVVHCLSFDQDPTPPKELIETAGIDWERVEYLAARHGVAPFLYHTLSRGDVAPPAVLRRLRAITAMTAALNRRGDRALCSVLAAFTRAAIPVLVLKGFALLHTVYKDAPGLRTCVDIDVLVRPADLSRAQDMLADLGYVPEKDPSREPDAYHGPLYLMPREPVKIEVHFHLVKPHTPFRVPLDELWQRARSVRIDGQEMLVCSPEDMILHGALHLSFHKEFPSNPLRQLRDLGEIVSKEVIDWAQLCDRARRYRADRSVYYALRLAKDLIRVAVPEQVLATLCAPIGRWELLLFNQVKRERVFLTQRDPARLFLQILLLQIPGYEPSDRRRVMFEMLRHPFRYAASAMKLLPAPFRSERIRVQHAFLAVQLCWKGAAIGLEVLRRALGPPTEESAAVGGHARLPDELE